MTDLRKMQLELEAYREEIRAILRLLENVNEQNQAATLFGILLSIHRNLGKYL